MREFLRAPLAFRLQCEIDASIQSRAGAQPAPDTPFFFHGQNVYLGQRSPIMRIFLFLLFCVCFFSVRGEVSINPLPPSYTTQTFPRIFWSFHTSYRVCLVPAVPYPPLGLNR